MTPAEVTAWLREQEILSDKYTTAADLIEALTAERDKLKTHYEAEVKFRKFYEEGKGNLYSMGGAIAEAAMEHLPCNEGGVNSFFLRNYVHREAFDAVTAERDALAGMALAMKETASNAAAACDHAAYGITYGTIEDCRQHAEPRLRKASDDLLALSELPAAVAQVQEWRESHRTLEAIDKILIEALEAAQAKSAKEAENASK